MTAELCAEPMRSYVVTRRWRLAPDRFRQTRTIMRAPSADLAAAWAPTPDTNPGRPLVLVELFEQGGSP